MNTSRTYLSYAGFDTIKLRLPWDELPLPVSAGFIGVDPDTGELGEHRSAFTKLRVLDERESWRGGWAFRPEVDEKSGIEYLILEGSAAKAATGQNIYLPREDLVTAVEAALVPFLAELRRKIRCEISDNDLRWVLRFALYRAEVMRLDLTFHSDLDSQSNAEGLVAHLDSQRFGIRNRNGAVRRLARQSDTSLSSAGRRLGLKVYLKYCEMLAHNHCPRLKKEPELLDEAVGLARFEFTLRTDGLFEPERKAAYWSAENLESTAWKLASKLAWPGVPAYANAQFDRVRTRSAPLIPARVISMGKEIAAAWGYDTVADVPPRQLETLLNRLDFVYHEKKFDYEIVERERAAGDGDEEMAAMRPVDKQWYDFWLQGMDIWATLHAKPHTAKRIRLNIQKAHGVDIRAPRDGVVFEPLKLTVLSPKPWVAKRDWRDLIAA